MTFGERATRMNISGKKIRRGPKVGRVIISRKNCPFQELLLIVFPWDKKCTICICCALLSLVGKYAALAAILIWPMVTNFVLSFLSSDLCCLLRCSKLGNGSRASHWIGIAYPPRSFSCNHCSNDTTLSELSCDRATRERLLQVN